MLVSVYGLPNGGAGPASVEGSNRKAIEAFTVPSSPSGFYDAYIRLLETKVDETVRATSFYYFYKAKALFDILVLPPNTETLF